MMSPKPLSLFLQALPEAVLSEGDESLLISQITHDSRLVQKGALFIALTGQNFNGHRFLYEAAAKGAAAFVLQEKEFSSGMALPYNIPALVVKNTREALPRIAEAFYDHPSQALRLVGVTGTNGKTTTTRMIAAVLRAAGESVGTIGTLGAELNGSPMPSDHTTPEADHLQRLLAAMREEGATAAVMEVSSHAIAQHRTEALAFSAAVFTNITRDHLDYHQTMEAYFETKARLFTEYPVKYPRKDGRGFTSVINVSQWEGRDLVTLARGDILTYTSEAGFPAVLSPEEIELAAAYTRFTACYDSGVEQFRLPITLPFGGAFQVGNALAAIGAALRMGIKPAQIAEGLAGMEPVPGRFEPVAAGRPGFTVIVDYAHTPDGLENLLHSARALHPGRIICLFGCGGDRDRTKRPIMGRLAATLADIAVVTSDNPRTEDPEAIIKEILQGMDPADPAVTAEITTVPDRRAAIRRAIEAAGPNDLVLLAGKGHEDYQIIGDVKYPFDDRTIAAEILQEQGA